MEMDDKEAVNALLLVKQNITFFLYQSIAVPKKIAAGALFVLVFNYIFFVLF